MKRPIQLIKSLSREENQDAHNRDINVGHLYWSHRSWKDNTGYYYIIKTSLTSLMMSGRNSWTVDNVNSHKEGQMARHRYIHYRHWILLRLVGSRVVPEIWDTEAGTSLDPTSLRPAWARLPPQKRRVRAWEEDCVGKGLGSKSQSTVRAASVLNH